MESVSLSSFCFYISLNFNSLNKFKNIASLIKKNTSIYFIAKNDYLVLLIIIDYFMYYSKIIARENH